MGNKRKYIFLINTVGGSAGGQLYLSAKIDWLQKEGYDVEVLYFDPTPITIENLKPFENGYVRNLEFRFALMSPKDRRETFEKVSTDWNIYNEIIIESFSIEMSLWGEYFASQCRGKHICYFLCETYPSNITPSIREFLEFKLNQGLLYGITPKSIPSIFPEADGDETTLLAHGCVREAEDLPLPGGLKLKEDAFTVLSIGRLEKPYIPELWEEVKHFAESTGINVNFIIVGSTKQRRIYKRLHSITETSPHLNAMYLGEVFPMPKKIFEISDVFAGCAGSARMAQKQGIPVISVDANDHKAIGILGETTDSALYRKEHEAPLPLNQLLKVIYNERDRRREERKNYKTEKTKFDFSRHKEVIEKQFKKEYYPVDKVRNGKLFTFVYGSIKKIGGNNLLYAVKKLKQHLS
ncbi:MAG: hypothetical protein J1F12_04130 [Muribaculaceae bacterium]|nr:hypothetical protein [Muribaculaceae bacterium]